ncbi:MAG: SURF1 family protein [Pseudomonadota bacterium]
MKFGRIFLAVCILVGVAFLSSLGVWQLQRLEWKLGLIARVEQGLKARPVAADRIAEAVAAGEDIEYRPAFAEGVFLHDAEAHYFATHNGKVGYFVYTPLQRDDGSVLFVNRGYVPMERKEAETRPDGQVLGRVRIDGLARSNQHDKPNSFVPNNDSSANVYHWKNINQMMWQGLTKMEDQVMPFFLDADATPVPGDGAPVGGVTRITFNNPHLQYALTWFGLAAALVGVGGWFFFSSGRGRAKAKA